MLGSSPGSPFRTGTGHRAPWPPPSHHAAEGFGRYGVSGGLYSLFPGSADASATIYSQATSAARFSHSNTYHSFIGSHKVADSLFSTGYTFGGPTPPPSTTSGPPFTPLVERGITQLELMAKGFNNSNNNNNANSSNNNHHHASSNVESSGVVLPATKSKSESKRRADCSAYQDGGGRGAGRRRWERDSQPPPSTPPVVKSEVLSRPSCGCRRSNVAAGSPSSLVVRTGPSSDAGAMTAPFPPPPPPPPDHHAHGHAAADERKKQQQQQQQQQQQHESSGGGCSRTTPVSLRAAPDWFGCGGGGGIVIKKEPAGGGTPCQVAEVTTSLRHAGAALSPLAAVIKVEGGRKEAATSASLHTQHLAVNAVSSIPVGIAVARQRLQDAASKPPPPQTLLLAPAPEQPPPRPQKALAPAPAPEVAAADLTAAPLSAMVLQPQCEDRVTNGIAPWAATTTHNPALTPPTLWQYPASVPVQLGPTEHLPLPPVGYQLVRDPISGHFLLIPTTNIEHLQRTVLWPSYPATIQPSLPTTQHIQLFESAEPAEYSAQTARILVQPQLTITAAPAPIDAGKRKPTVIKIEDCSNTIVDGSTAIVKSHHPVVPASRTSDVSVATNTVSVPVLSSSTTTVTPVSQFFYDHSTAVVQLAQTPQPSASVQTDTGKRSQATSPVNPAETCLTPPPEVAPAHSESEDVSVTSLAVPVTTEAPVQVQDASNQTDTPPISEDEICDSGGGKLPSLEPPVDFLQQLPALPLPPPPPPPPPLPTQAPPLVADLPPPLPLPAQSPSAPRSAIETEERRHDIGSPTKQTEEMVDLSGLELLSNSIEQFENIHHKTVDSSVQQGDAKMLPETASTQGGDSARGSCSPSLVEEAVQSAKQDGDLGPSVEKAAETLQLLCQQSAQLKKLEPEPATVGGADGCDKLLVEVSDKVDGKSKPQCEDVELQTVTQGETGTNMLGGLGLLCALAEQRFMEEVASSNSKSSVALLEPSTTSENTSFSSHDSGITGSVDVNRNYRTRESERECKKFIANKVLQYYHNGNCSGSSSPQHPQHHSLLSGICTSPSSADFMDAMELDMRMRLAELQRKYREKQRELSKLTPKKPGSESGSSSVTSPEAPSVSSGSHQVKRGPGRPRKKCNKLVLDSPPLSPPSGGSCTKFRSSKSSGSKLKDSNRDPPPPVLEKVTDIQRPRLRLDSEDCVAPKLKASRLDILKPPTLTANKILTCAKFKPTVSSSSADSNVKLPHCNVNLVKLNSGQQDSTSEKETAGKLLKNNSAITSDSNKGKLSPLSFSDSNSPLDKLSAFTSGRLPLMHAPSHTFGSKPSTCLLGAGDESLFWFKNSEKSSCFGKLSDRSSPEVENSESTIPKLKSSSTPPPLPPPVATFASLSPVHASALTSSQKRKVGRPKKHLSMTGCELTTETIVAKKPKSKSNLVGLLLSKTRHSTSYTNMPKPVTNSATCTLFKPIGSSNSPEHSLSFSKLSSSALKSTAGESSSTFSRPFAATLLKSAVGSSAPLDSQIQSSCKSAVSPTVFKNAASLGQSKNTSVIGQKKNGSVAATDLCAADGHKPNKIRPKLKAEAKVKTWSWCEDDDVVAIDWSAPTQEKNQNPSVPVQAQAWTKKTEKAEKTEKAAVKGAAEGPGRPPKRKLSAEGKAVVGKGMKRGPPAGKAKEKRSSSSEKKEEVPAPSPAKKQRRNNSSCHSSGGGTSESEDLPLSMLSRQSQASCVLTQAHLNVDKQRALTVMGGLFYAGTISAIQAPDVYGITLDGERGNRPHIFSREEILRDAILEVRVSDITTLTPGTRVCAYWSQQYRCLYPGTVAEPSSPDSELDAQFVSVEFDDGDNGRINMDDIRLLPADYPIVEYDPNPLLTLGKRRRRNSGTSCESHSKDRRTSGEASTPATTTTKATEGQAVEKSDGVSGQKASDRQSNVAPDDSSQSDSGPGNGRLDNDQVVDDALEEGKKLRLEDEDQNKDESNDLSSRERKRLKKRRREKLKRLLSCSGVALSLDGSGKKRHKKHRCSDEHSRHRRHHRRHRRHKRRHGSRNKDSSGGSSGESSSKTSGDGDTSSRLSPVLEQLDILEIQQTAIRQIQAGSQPPPTTEVVLEPLSGAIPGKDKSTSEPVSNLAISEPSISTVPASEAKKGKKDKETGKAKKGRDRQPSVESRSKMAAFLPARQLWGWSGRGFKRPGAKGRGKKEFFKAIQRGKETIRVGDCAVFLSTGRPDRPYIGRIESMWESWGTNMVVRVKWFYHPEETNGCTMQLKYPGALFESPHVDENDVQTISHKCEVLPLSGYTERLGSEPQRYSTIYDNNDIYYLAGYYDPTTTQLTMEPGIP